MTELPTKKIGEQVPLGSLVSEFEILHGRKAAFWRAIGKIDAMDPEMRQHHRENFYIASKVAALSEAGIKRGRPYFGAVMTAYHIIKEELAESNHPVFDAQSIKRWKNDNPLNQECTRIPGAAHVLHAYWRFGSNIELVSAANIKTLSQHTYITGVANNLVHAILAGKISDSALRAISYHRMDMHGLVIP